MRVPASLGPLVDQGVIDEVLRPLLSGKEADVYLVDVRGELRVAKVYKDAHNRSFKHRADYTEGRKVRNSRQQRAMDNRSKYGRAQVEEAWRSAEVDVIYKLHYAGVRSPIPYDFIDGVLVMELIADRHGEPAPRLVDLDLSPELAEDIFAVLIREVVKMLCAGVVHADLSDFNVLLGVNGPVIIDFPQAVDPAHNRNARQLFLRDVDNITRFLGRFAPRLLRTRYAMEIWTKYERGELHPDSELRGEHRADDRKVDTRALVGDLRDVERENARRNPQGVRVVAVSSSRGARRGSGNGAGQARGAGGPGRGAGGQRTHGGQQRGGGEPRADRGQPRADRGAARDGREARTDRGPQRGGGEQRADGGPPRGRGEVHRGGAAEQHGRGAPQRGSGGPPRGPGAPPADPSGPTPVPGAAPGDAPAKRRRRRRRRRGGGGGAGGQPAPG